jgi:urease accessory protein
MSRSIGLTVLFMAMAAPALAHPGHDASGFLHPFTGIDHMMAAVGVGVWAFLLANRRASLAVLVPASFLVMMAGGAIAGFAGIKLPLVEAVILASVFVMGGLIVGAVRLPAALAMAVVGLFAVFHGYAHATEASQTDPVAYILGMLAGTAVLQAVGLGLGWLVRRLEGELGLRALGGVVLAGGALFWMTN